MKVLILDTETTGLDPSKDVVIEVAAILYDLAHGPISSYSSLICHDQNPSAAINGISVEALQSAPASDAVWPDVAVLLHEASAIVAHNATFDQPFVAREIACHDKPFVCSEYDLVWPRGEMGTSLVALALAHDLAVMSAHRAMDDCILLSRLFTRARELGADLEAMISYGMRPKATFQALVSFEQKDLAKNAKFRWEPETKRWLRTMAVEDTKKLGFQVKEVSK